MVDLLLQQGRAKDSDDIVDLGTDDRSYVE